MDTEGHDIHARSRSGQYPVGKNSSHRARSTGQPGRHAVFKNSFQNSGDFPYLQNLKPQDSLLLPEMGAHDSEIGKLSNRRGKPEQEHPAAKVQHRKQIAGDIKDGHDNSCIECPFKIGINDHQAGQNTAEAVERNFKHKPLYVIADERTQMDVFPGGTQEHGDPVCAKPCTDNDGGGNDHSGPAATVKVLFAFPVSPRPVSCEYSVRVPPLRTAVTRPNKSTTGQARP